MDSDGQLMGNSFEVRVMIFCSVTLLLLDKAMFIKKTNTYVCEQCCSNTHYSYTNQHYTPKYSSNVIPVL